MTRGVNAELNIGIAIGAGNIQFHQFALDHADGPISLPLAKSKHPAYPRQDARQAQPTVLRMEPGAAAKANFTGNTSCRLAGDVKRRMVRHSRIVSGGGKVGHGSGGITLLRAA